MYRWFLYQVEELVIAALDLVGWSVDRIFLIPWRWLFFCALCILFVLGLTI